MRCPRGLTEPEAVGREHDNWEFPTNAAYMKDLTVTARVDGGEGHKGTGTGRPFAWDPEADPA
jgi:hypothetical protein